MAVSPLMQQTLPLYTLRESRRARNVHLQVTPADGLVITVPLDFSKTRLPAILKQKQAWIDRAMRWADEQRSTAARRVRGGLPKVIFLQSIGEAWDVVYNPTQADAARAAERRGEVLAVSGCVHDRSACRVALKRWLARKTHQGLVPLLDEMSAVSGLAFRRAMVANQKTRWGSCSPKGTISLNQKLLFLPERMVRYVLMHELCHTVHLNHSRKFWTLLDRMEPSCRELDSQLREAGKFVPEWAE